MRKAKHFFTKNLEISRKFNIFAIESVLNRYYEQCSEKKSK